MMFGIATSEQTLVSPTFTNLLGADRHGWALSHHGLAWHDGISRSFLSRPMEPLRPVLIGLQFDADARTLSYTINNQSMGIAFHSIPTDFPIYPAVSSTSAQSTIILRHRCTMCTSLRETCLKFIKSTMRVNASCPFLPRHLIAQMMK
jgi:SPRY domain-containing SOCS box protein 3